jgi:hypothetical protein
VRRAGKLISEEKTVMRKLPAALIFVTLLAIRVLAQSLADSHFEAHSYVNTYFHFSYTWPEILQPYDPTVLHLPHNPSNNEFLLFSARQGQEPFGIVVMAERLHVPTAHTNGIQNGADFVDRAVHTLDSAGNPKILLRKHFVNASGIEIDELDYVIYGEYSSGIAARFGDFVVAFRCNAKSAEDLARMTHSVADLHTQK